MHQSIVFCSACATSSQRKFTFAVSSSHEFLVCIVVNNKKIIFDMYTVLMANGRSVLSAFFSMMLANEVFVIGFQSILR